MNIQTKDILDILLKHDYVERQDVDAALEDSPNDPLVYLYKKEIISKDLVGEAIAESFGITYTNLKINTPSTDLILTLPENFAVNNKIVLVSKDSKNVVAATSELGSLARLKLDLEGQFPDTKVKVTFSFENDIEDLFKVYKKDLTKRLSKILKKDYGVATESLNEIIQDAIGVSASDIHFEPQEKDVLIKFRVDGVLQEVGDLSKDTFENVINRVKVLANLRLDEHFSTQDGAIRMEHADRKVDLRISIAPTINGQNVVIRILTEYIKDLTLSDLGFSDLDVEILGNAYKKPFGMILSVGPTGSGKTTTLYSILKEIQTPGLNITTIEDPVEYKIPKINQIQVSQVNNLTFANGLRSIVRQDPNVILVGEIRDMETSEIAINAALTGHLLLTTFHANDAATAIVRLLDMGAEPFLLSSTLSLIIAQRLVRRICTSCRYSYSAKRKDFKAKIPEINKYFDEESITLYKGKGCPVCNGTGYKGRIGIFELIYNTPEIQDIILKNPSSSAIKAVAAKQGAHSFFDDGISKVKTGLISIEELLRVAPPNIKTQDIYE